MIVTLHAAFEYLARVAVFIEQARIGENLAVNENVSFENEFRQLEDDHEAGLYWLDTVSQSTGRRRDWPVLDTLRPSPGHLRDGHGSQPGSDSERHVDARRGGGPQRAAAHARLPRAAGLRAPARPARHRLCRAA